MLIAGVKKDIYFFIDLFVAGVSVLLCEMQLVFYRKDIHYRKLVG